MIGCYRLLSVRVVTSRACIAICS